MPKQLDRVNFSYSMKIPGPVQFSSITFGSSYSSDVEPDETPEAAMERARKFVMSEVEKDFNASSSRAEAGYSTFDDSEFAPVRQESKASKGGKGKRKPAAEEEGEEED